MNINPTFDAEVGYYIDTTVAELLVLTGMEEMRQLSTFIAATKQQRNQRGQPRTW